MQTIKDCTHAIRTAFGTARDAIQSGLQIGTVHAYQHGDWHANPEASEFLAAIQTLRGHEGILAAIRDWCAAHSCLRLELKKGEAPKFVLSKKARAEGLDAEKLNVKWYEFKAESKSDDRPYDVKAQALAILRAMEKAQDKGRTIENVHFAAYITAAVQAYDAKVEAAKILAFKAPANDAPTVQEAAAPELKAA